MKNSRGLAVLLLQNTRELEGPREGSKSLALHREPTATRELIEEFSCKVFRNNYVSNDEMVYEVNHI